MDVNKSMDENNVYNSDNYKGFMTLMGMLYMRDVIPIKICIECINTIKNTIFKTVVGAETNISMRTNTECSNFHKGYEHLLTHILFTLNNKITVLMQQYNTKDEIIRDWKNLGKVDKLLDGYVKGKKVSEILNNSNETILTNFIELKKYVDNIAEVKKEIVDKQLEVLNGEFDKLQNVINQYGETLDTLLQNHQEFMTLNSKFKCVDSKHQLVVCLKQYNIMSHNNNGLILNNMFNLIWDGYKPQQPKYKTIKF